MTDNIFVIVFQVTTNYKSEKNQNKAYGEIYVISPDLIKKKKRKGIDLIVIIIPL